MNTHPVHTEIRGKGKKEGWEEGNKDDRRKKKRKREGSREMKVIKKEKENVIIKINCMFVSVNWVLIAYVC